MYGVAIASAWACAPSLTRPVTFVAGGTLAGMLRGCTMK